MSICLPLLKVQGQEWNHPKLRVLCQWAKPITKRTLCLLLQKKKPSRICNILH